MTAAPVKLLTPTGVLAVPAQLLETWLAPRLMAVAMPASRSDSEELLVSTSRMWQVGHSAETASRSRETAASQSVPAGLGIGEAVPLWLTLVKQPLPVVQGGSPYVLR